MPIRSMTAPPSALTASGPDYSGVTGGVAIAVIDDDTAAPTISSIERWTPSLGGRVSPRSPNNADSLTWRVTFSEAVTNVDNTDFTVSGDGGSLGGPTLTATQVGSSNAWDVNISGGNLADYNGTVTLSLAGNQDITDADNNPLSTTLPGDNTYVLDNAGPTIINASINGATLTVTFSEDVGDLRASVDNIANFNITVPGHPPIGTASGINTSNYVSPGIRRFTMSSAVSAGDTVTLNVNNSSDSGPITFDFVRNPLANVSNLAVTNLTPGLLINPTRIGITEGGDSSFSVKLVTQPAGTVLVTVAQPSNTDITVDTDSGSAGNQTILAFTRSNWDTAQTVTVSAAADADRIPDNANIGIRTSNYGNVTGSVAVAVADNDSLDPTDTTAPTITGITRQTPATSPTNADSLTWRVSFSEAVSNIDGGDFSVSGAGLTTPTLSVARDGSSNAWDVSISGGNLNNYNGTVTLSLAGNQNIIDNGGNILVSTLPGGAADTYVLDNTVPTVLDASVNGATLTVTFSETLADTKAPNAAWAVSVANSARSVSSYTLSGATASLTLASAVSHSQTVTLGYTRPGSGDTLRDLVGHELASLSNQGVTNVTPDPTDTTAPTITGIMRQTPATSPTNADSLTWRVSFSEAVINIDGGDFSVSGDSGSLGSPTLTATQVSSSNVWDVSASGGNLAAYDGTVTLGLASNQNIIDNGANALTSTLPGDAQTYVLDNTAPTVLDASVNGSTLIVTFSETLADILPRKERWGVSIIQRQFLTVSRPSSYTLSGNTATITLRFTALANQTIFLSYTQEPLDTPSRDDHLQDLAGNELVDFLGLSVTSNTPAPATPTGTIQVTPAGTLTIDEGASGNLSVSLSTAPNANVTVSLAKTNTDVSLSATSLTFTTANWDTSQTVTVSAAQDNDGTDDSDTITLTATGGIDASSVTKAVTITDDDPLDTTAPTITGITRQTPVASPTNADSLTWRVSFGEAVSNVNNADFTVSGDSGSLGSPTLSVARDGTTNNWDVTVSGGNLADYNGTVTLGLDSSQNITDSANNALSSTLPGDAANTYVLDNTAPSISDVSRRLPATSPTSSDTLSWRITFDETLEGLDAADFIVSGDSGSLGGPDIAIEAESTVTWRVNVSGGNLAGYNGVVTLGLDSSHNITDSAGNAVSSTLVPSDDIENTYTVDNTAPTVLDASVNGTTLTITFSEAMDSNLSLTTAAWDVKVDGNDRALVGNSITLSTNTTITMTLGSAVVVGESVSLDYLKRFNAAYRWKDLAGNELADFSNLNVANTTPDTTAPTVLDASVNGTTLTVTFSETMSSTKAPDSAWAVSVAGNSVSVSSYTLSDNTAILTLASAVVGGDAVTLGYTKPGSGDTLKDTSDNELATFSNQSVTNNTPDPSTPTGTIQVTPSGTLTIDEGASGNLSVSLSTQPNADVTVSLAKTNADVTLSATSLTFTSSNWDTSQTVTVSAAQDADTNNDSDTITLTATGGIDASSVAKAVTITDDDSADTTPPTITGITRQTPATSPTNADSLTWRVSFSEAVSNVDNADFSVSGDSGNLGSPTLSVAQDGSNNAWDVSASGGNLATYNGTVTLGLASNQDIADSADNALSTTLPGDAANTYVLDNAAPTVLDASVNGTTLTVTFSEALDSTQMSPAGFWAADVAGRSGNVNPSSYTLLGNTATLTLNAAITAGETLTLGYLKPSSGATLQDLAGNELASFFSQSVTNNTPDTTAPTVLDASVNGATLTVTFSETMDSTKASDSAWAVSVAGNSVSVSSYTLSDNTAILTLASAVVGGDAVTLGYTKPGSGDTLKDTSDNELATFSNRSVTNNTPDPSTPTGTIQVTPAGTLTITEGASGNLSVSLGTQPNADVTVSLAKTNADVTLSATSLTFTTANWDTSQTVTVSAAQDADTNNDSDTITLSATGGIDASSVTKAVTITDDDSADTTAPTITGITRQTPATSPTNADSLSWRVSFSEAVTNIDNADFSVSGDSGNLGSPTLSVARDGTTNNWDIGVSGGNLAGYNGTVTLGLASNQDIADSAGNALSTTLPGDASNTWVLDNTVPTITDASVNGATLTVTFSETLADTKAPNSAWVVNVANTARNVSSYILSGTTATLTLASAVTHSQTITLGYTQPGSGDTLHDTADNELATFSNQSVTNNTPDPSTPTGTIQVTPAGTLTITEGASGNLSVSLGTQPNADVTVSLAKTNADVTLSATSLTFTSSNWDTSQTVTVSAAQDADTDNDSDTITLSATGGIDASSVTKAVTITDDDTADTTAPTITGITRQTPATSPTNADSLGWRVSFSEAVSNVDNADFSVSGDSGNLGSPTLSVARDGTTNAWDISASGGNLATYNGTVTLGLASNQDIADSAGNALSTTLPGDASNTWVLDNTVPTITDASVNGATLTVTFSETLADTKAPNSAWVVNVANTARNVSSYILSGTTATLTLASAVTHSQTITLGYTQPGSGDTLHDTADNELATFSNQSVTNNTADTTAPTVLDASVNGATLTVTFSETLADTKAPNSAWVVNVANTARNVSSYTLSGTTAILTLASAVVGGDAVTLGYTKPGSGDTLKDTSDNELATFSNRSVTNNTPDPSTPTGTIQVTPAGTLTINEGASGNLSVSLGTQPASDVTVSLAKTNTDVSLSATSLTFTTANWDTSQTVTVSAAQDADTNDDSDTITLTATGGIDASSVTKAVTITDDDSAGPGLTINPPSVTIGEGSSGNFTVSLTTQPSENVTVTVAQPSNTDITVDTDSGTAGNQTTLTFTSNNWSTAQGVTVSTAEDADMVDDSASLSITATGADYGGVTGSVNVTVTDLGTTRPEPPPGSSAPTFGSQVQADLNLTQGVAIAPVTLPAASGGDGALQYRISPSLPAGLRFNAVTRQLSGTPVSLGTTHHNYIASDSDNDTRAEDQASLGFNINIRVSRDTATRQATQGWLSRFGRGIGEQAVQGIRKRIQQPVTTGPQPGAAQLQTNLGGHSIDLNQPLSSTAAGLLKQLEQLDRSNLLYSSSFSASGESGEGQLSLWGQGAHSSFASKDNGVDLDGKLSSLLLGSDYRRDNWAAGILLSRSKGEGDYRGEVITGELESDLTGVVPWGSIQMSEELSIWGAMGQGQGDLRLQPERESEIKADLDWQMLAGGMQSRLIKASERNRMGLSFTGDLLWTETTTDRVARLQAIAGETRRVRLGLEADWYSSGGLTPRLELGIRHDSGDAETGLGVELGGGLVWQDGRGNRLEVNGRGLLTHDDSDSRDWGLSIVAQHDARPSSHRGFSLRLSHELGGSATGGIERLMKEDLLSAGSTAGHRWELEMAYGMARARGLTGSGYTALSGGAGSGLGWRVGYRLQSEHTSEFEIDLHVLDAREADEVDPGVGLNFIWR